MIADSVELDSFQTVAAMISAMVGSVASPNVEDNTWDQVFVILQEMETGYFASSAGPDGTPWLPLKPATIAKKGHGIILRETYDLEKSLTSVNAQSIRNRTGDSAEFGTNREWSWVHQAGNDRIPQRMFLGINEDATEKVVDLIADSLIKQMFAAEW